MVPFYLNPKMGIGVPNTRLLFIGEFTAMHSKFLRMHFKPYGSTPTTTSAAIAKRGTNHVI